MQRISATMDCPDCGHAVSVDATTCPSCGATLASTILGIYLPRPEALKPGIAVAAVVIVLGLVAFFSPLLLLGLLLMALVVVLRSESRKVALPNPSPDDGVTLPHGFHLTECANCGHAVSLRAASCPSCGVPPPRSGTRRRALNIMFAGLGLYVFGYFFGYFAGLGFVLTLATEIVGLVLFMVGVFLAES